MTEADIAARVRKIADNATVAIDYKELRRYAIAELKAEQEKKEPKKFTRFKAGSGCYTCQQCGKRTRETGEGEAMLKVCAVCLAKGEAANVLIDHGFQGDEHAVFADCKTKEEVWDKQTEYMELREKAKDPWNWNVE